MSDPKRVAILIETSTSWGHGLIRGISDYAKRHTPWVFFLEPRGRSEALRLPSGWTGDGVIARVNSPELAHQLVERGIPSVDVSWYEFAPSSFGRCTLSSASIARLAVEHFAERGLRSLGYCEPLGRPGYNDHLGIAFKRQAEARGCSCSIHSAWDSKGEQRPWGQEMDDLVAWVERLDKPAGVLAFSDVRGREVAEACWLAGLRVPDDVAVLGSEQDELSAMISTPPLSSIDIGAERVGFAAAEMLDAMMLGGSPPAEPVHLDPIGVITRQSTDVYAIADPTLARALAYVAEHIERPIQVEDVLDHLSISRRMLEQRFMRILGQTPAAVIRRKRLERASRLLYDTELSIAEIASRCGFRSPETMTRAFRSEFGCPPSSMRVRGNRSKGIHVRPAAELHERLAPNPQAHVGNR